MGFANEKKSFILQCIYRRCTSKESEKERKQESEKGRFYMKRKYEIALEEMDRVFANSPNPKATKNIMIGVVIAAMLLPLISVMLIIFGSGGDKDSGRYVRTDGIVSWTESTVVGGEITNIMYVNYFGEDDYYEKKKLDEYVLTAKVGDTITIYYDRENPTHIFRNKPIEETSGGSWIDKIIFIVAALAMVGAGAFVLLKVMGQSEKKRQELMANGIKVDAVIEDIVVEAADNTASQPRVIVYCKYKDESSGVIHRFKSGRVPSYNPMIEYPMGANVRVYIQPGDYSKYYVDTDSVVSDGTIDSRMPNNSVPGNGMVYNSMIDNSMPDNSEKTASIMTENKIIDYSE